MKKLHLIAMMILLAFGCTMLPSPVKAAGDNLGSPIVGLWLRTATDPNDPNFVSISFQTFHRDHTAILSSSAPPAAGNICSGVWIRDMGPRTYKLEQYCWRYDDNGVIGTFRVRDTVTVATSGDSYSGTAELAFCDTNGENCSVLINGNVEAVRRTVGF